MKEFEWKKWNNKTYRLIQRFSKWTGFQGYQIKHTLGSFLSSQIVDSTILATLTFGHQKQSHTNPYITETQLGTLLTALNKIIIPDLKILPKPYE